MHFRIDRSTSRTPNSILVYRPEEYSFDTEPAPAGSLTSVLVDDLNLEIDDAGRVISVWGMCSYTRWLETSLSPPEASLGDLFVVSDVPFVRGVSVRLNRDKYLPVHVDKASGWVRIQGGGSPASSVKLLPGVIFEITEHGQFCSLWLRPQQASGGCPA